jgi:pSer/pThr/pTyr-binding forkhead associated (FHA) protein
MSDDQGNPEQPTVGKKTTASFRLARPASRWVGMLIPIGGLATQDIRLDQDEIVVGRASLGDESVSRRHARITRRGDEFELEDLGSFNGTHVDGVPVRSCVLYDGDTVQIGQTLYRFERILEAASAAGGSQP